MRIISESKNLVLSILPLPLRVTTHYLVSSSIGLDYRFSTYQGVFDSLRDYQLQVIPSFLKTGFRNKVLIKFVYQK